MPSERRSWLEIAGWVSLAVSLLVRLLTTWSRPYFLDEMFLSHAAILRSGPGVPQRDYFLLNFTPIAELAAPLFRAFPESFVPIYILRGLMFLVGAALVFLTYRLAVALGANRVWALVAVNVLSWHPKFATRIGDIRSDAIAAIFLILPTLILIRRRGTFADAIKAGLLFGGAGALTYKLGIAAPIFAAAILLDGRPRRIARTFVFAVMSAIPPIGYFGLRLALDGREAFLKTWEHVFAALRFGNEADRIWLLLRMIDPALVVIAILAGAVLMLFSGRGLRLAYAALVLAFLMMFVVVNPFIFPYNYVILMPFLAPMVIGLDQLRLPGRFQAAPAAVMLLTAVGTGALPIAAAVSESKEWEERVVKWTWTATDKSEGVFNLQGRHLWRRGMYHWWHVGGFSGQYQQDPTFNAADEMRRGQVATLIEGASYDGLRPADREFIESHYIAEDTCMLVAGWSFRREELERGATFHAFLDEAEYRVMRPEKGVVDGIEIDGQPLRTRIRLRAGTHRIVARPGAQLPPVVALAYTTPRREKEGPLCTQRGVVAIKFGPGP